ncbi:MAG TPA: molybdate ABC transporter substrate-binding protein [Vicinamibacteria bacterium]
MVERAALAAGFSLLLAGSLSAQEGETTVRVFAAASLADSLAEVLEHFEASHPGIRVVPQFGASNDLARQILAGAPAHLFLSADERQMDRAAADGWIEDGWRRDLLSNQLVIVEGRAAPSRIRGPQDLERVDRIALGDPEAVPAGVYARQYLEKLGLWERLRSRVVPTLDVRAALAAVASGNVDAGFVYRTDASLEGRVRVAFEVPREEGPPIAYPLALARGGSDEARALYRFLGSAEASAVFERHGFIVLEGEK